MKNFDFEKIAILVFSFFAVLAVVSFPFFSILPVWAGYTILIGFVCSFLAAIINIAIEF